MVTKCYPEGVNKGINFTSVFRVWGFRSWQGRLSAQLIRKDSLCPPQWWHMVTTCRIPFTTPPGDNKTSPRHFWNRFQAGCHATRKIKWHINSLITWRAWTINSFMITPGFLLYYQITSIAAWIPIKWNRWRHDFPIPDNIKVPTVSWQA